MKSHVLLIVIIGVFLLLAGCNGAALEQSPTTPVPGGGANDLQLEEMIEGNYAIDILPQREIPPTLPIEDPDWEPSFASLTEDPACIDEGCITFTLDEFDKENLTVDFDATFFNWNAENFNSLTVFLVITDMALGVELIEPDGMIKLDEFDTVEYPYYAFNNENNPGDNDVPGTMYCYFERDIGFSIVPGYDFSVSYLLVAVIDQHDLSYKIEIPGRETDPNIGGGGEEEDGRPGQFAGGDDDSQSSPQSGTVRPPLAQPGH